jgi:radical SAM superfamily enzyme YgiQ (UPF0313 family)
MNVLLVNPNRYKSPPVPPIGLEYLAASLESKGHRVEIADLCFSESPLKDVDHAILSFRPDVVGVTVRNVDSVLFHTNEFFLDGIREIVHHIKNTCGLKVIIGGAGVTTNPEGILEYLDADIAVAGPAENTIHEVLEDMETPHNKKIFYGRYTGTSSLQRACRTDYRKYCADGGVAGFETHKGCSSSCAYCIEANSKVTFKNPSDVIAEIKGFVDQGHTHFHLCDAEFNESLEYSIEFCTALKREGIDIKWAVYMKPANFNRKLFQLLKDTGVYLITLSVDSWKKCPLYWTDIERFIFGAKSCGIKVAVDFLTGFPYESREEIFQYLETLRRPLPDSVGINTYIRLYKSLQITRSIFSDTNLREHIIGAGDDVTLVKPVFYNHIGVETLEQFIGGDSVFRIEGIEKGVNYNRVGS